MFSLGSGSKEEQQEEVLKNQQEIYNKGYHLYYHQLHQQRLLDFSVGPRNDVDGDESSSYSYRSAAAFKVTRQGSRGGGSGGIHCQNCGNQAKKDCVYLRCRTCCNRLGYDCQTHVTSTWVPAAKRRERLLLQEQMTENPKRMRENHAVADASALACRTTSRLPSTTLGFEVGNFPAEVNSPAVFRGLRMRAVDDEEEHYAYETEVNIAGHVFKGILYDQGWCGGSQQQPLHLIAGAAATSAAAVTSNPHIKILDSLVYPAPLNAFFTKPTP